MSCAIFLRTPTLTILDNVNIHVPASRFVGYARPVPSAPAAALVTRQSATPHEAAAIAAAIAQFRRDTTPPAAAAAAERNPWQRAALLEHIDSGFFPARVSAGVKARLAAR